MDEEPLHTVVDALIACGVDNAVLFMGQKQAACITDEIFNGSFLSCLDIAHLQRACIADKIFNGSFSSCLDITFKELDKAFKAYSELIVAQGQICVPAGIRKNIKAFLQWTLDEIRLAQDPSDTPFPVNQVLNLIRRYKTHEQFITNSKTLAEAAKLEKFKEATK